MVLIDYIYKFVPKKLRIHLNQLLIYNGSSFDLPKLINLSLLLGVGLGIIFSVITQWLLKINFILFFPLYILALWLVIYIILVLSADSRGRLIDLMLPDFLRLMAANLKAGIDPAKALFLSIRPEFGPLAYEMRLVGREVIAGKTLSIALRNLTKRVKSKNLTISIDLIIVGIKSGRGLADSLTRLAKILKEREFLRKEVKSNVLMYIYLIFFAICIGGPLLFAVSTFLYQTLFNVGQIIATKFGSSSAEMPASAQFSMSIHPDFMVNFSLIAIVSSAIIGSFIIGLITSGKEKNGIKYTIPFCLIALLFFLGIRYIIGLVFGGYFTL